MYKLNKNDVVEWAKAYDGEPFHAILTDPPYHLTTITKRFGKPGSAPAKFGKDGAFARASRGFMGKTWDGGDVAFQPDTWAALGEHLHPGAFGMAFGSSRLYHRLAVAIEDAGFIIHPNIFGWVHGSGMPKPARIDKRIDKEAGKERKVVGKADGMGRQNPEWNGTAKGRKENAYKSEYEVTEAATELAKAWEGHRYGLQALRPMLEPFIVFQKPYEGRPIDDMVETGAGGLNIEDCRVTGGRWPANLVLVDEGAGEALDAQSGVKKGKFVRNRTDGARVFNNRGKPTGYETVDTVDGEDGGASIYFYKVYEQIIEADPVVYCKKVDTNEREDGLIGEFPCIVCGDYDSTHHCVDEKAIKCRRCNHPTLKPIGLTKYLSTLLLPPAAYAPRRILVPFCGSASEMIGAHLAGWDYVEGIDNEQEYIDIADARLRYWTGLPRQIGMEI